MSRFGVDGFDQLVPEGIPKAGTVLLLVPSTEEKDQIAAQFLLEGLRNGDVAIVIESEAAVRDLLRRLGNLGFDGEKAVADGRLVPLDWARAAPPKNGGASGLPAVETALSAAAAAKTRPTLRIVIDLSGTLPEALGTLSLDDLARRLAEVVRGLGALSLVLAPRAQGVTPEGLEAFDLVLDLRPLKPSGAGLAVIAIGGTPLPRSHMNLSVSEGRLVLGAARQAVGPASASVECPVCKSIIPAGASECPVCKSPRPVRQPGEVEVLDYIEALGQRVGLPGAPLEPGAPAARAPPTPEAPPGKEGAPSRPEPARRGLTNGLAKRRKMAAPAAPQGRVNGLTSLITAARRGMTNGLTNGNGFTNGLGAKRFVSESRQRAWHVYLIPIVAVLLLALPLFLSPEVVTVNTFGIDGSFAEWKTLAPVPADPALPGAIDLTAVGVRMDQGQLFGYVETRGPLLQGTPTGPGTDALRMFIDKDGNADSGYLADGIGADVLVEITGARGAIISAAEYVWPPSGADTADWSSWNPVDGVLAAVGRGAEANRIEFAIPPLRDPWSPVLRASFEGLSYDGKEDVSGFAVSPDQRALVVEQRSIAPGNFTSGDDLLEIHLRTPIGPTVVSSVTVEAMGTLPVTSLRSAVLRDASQVQLASAGSYRNGFQFALGSAYPVTAAPTTLRVSVQVDPAGRGTLGLAVRRDGDVFAPNTTVSVSTLPEDRDLAYVGAASPGVVIDGAFGDWPLPQADDLSEPTTRGNTDIDIAAYDSQRSGNTISVYARTVGRILNGGLVPAGNPEGQQPAPPDTDRDGVPDSVESALGPGLPFDFNNDNVTDANSRVSPTDPRPDRDGDGLPDYPEGGDVWLNTTIPAWYPSPYAGRRASVYIGPIQRPVVRGEDTLRVFIDSDANASTGYAATVGADWMVEIAGRRGVPRNASLFRFTGSNPGEWSWSPAVAPALLLAIGTRQIELNASLPFPASVGTGVVIDLRDWKGGSDESGVRTRSSTRSSRGTSVEAGDYAVDLPADLQSSDGVRIATDRFSATWSLMDVVADTPSGTLALPLSADPLVSDGSRASYGIRLGGASASLRYAFGPGALKEELVLSAPPADPEGFESFRLRFSVSFSSGASLLPISDSFATRGFGEAGDYAIIVGGAAVARFPAPFASDADSRTTPCAYDVPATGVLDVACPASILRSARFPVAIDPSTTFTLTNNGPYNSSGENMGWSVAAGDFNGDGYLDVLSGAPLNSKDGANFGMAYIYLGPFSAGSSSPDVNLKGNGTALYRAGYGVAEGDFNNDGIDDAVVGQQNGGPTLIFYGRSSWPGTVSTANVTFPVPSPIAAESFGRAVIAGNFDGSGGDDLVIGRPYYSGVLTPHGRAYLFFSPFSAYEPTADLTLAPFNDTKGHFGWSMSTGRIDSDAKDDLIVGETTVTAGINTYGRISLFKGSSLTGSGTKKPDVTIIQTTVGSQFGNSTSVGKLNGDSYDDVVVGAPGLSNNNGAAYIFLAKSDGTGLNQNQSASVTLPNQASAERFGSSVLILDYFSDGTADVISGAPAYGSNQGRVYVFNNPLSDQVVDETLTGQGSGLIPEQFGHVLAGGKKANDPRSLLIIGGPFWDDTGEIDSGRAVVASIPEFSDVGFAAGVSVIVLLVVRRRGRRK